MQKKYTYSLVVIGIMLILTLTISTSYGLWVATKDSNENLSSETLNCFKVYYSDSNTITMKNISPVVNEEGQETSPYTLTITNVCNDEKELQVRLNIIDETTVDTKSLTIEAAGNIEQKTILYKNLNNTKTTEVGVTQSKLIGQIKMEPNETIRTNIKIWFDEKKSPIISKDAVLKARFELIDTDSAIKATFAETILQNIEQIEKKEIPNFENTSNTEDGLFLNTTSRGKTYYYRGIVNNNYVSFANMIWRIIRVNEDNTIRLILDKSSDYLNFNDYTNYPDYVALSYVYYGEETNNKVQNYLNEWYINSIANKGLDNYVVTSSFCNDTSNYTEDYHTYFNGYSRLVSSKSPNLNCPEKTVNYGGTYNQKVGLITADEVVLAGGLYETNNLKYYLYNGENFYTLTGAEYYQYNAYLFTVDNNGMLTINKPSEYLGIRPVISLNASVTVSGSGTLNNPYTIDRIE